MSRYNLYSAEAFASLIKRDPREILKIMLEVSESSRLYPDSALLVPFTSIPIDPPKNVHVRDFGRLFVGSGLCRDRVLPSMEIVNKRIKTMIPFANNLSWDNYVASGSFAALVCQPIHNITSQMLHRPNDVDFYLYSEPKSRGESSIEEATMHHYLKLLEEIATASKSIAKKYFTKRNLNCTTIIYRFNAPMTSSNTKHQIIHRTHTSPTSVVIGFDLLACKAFYDGEMVYFTLDAALCLYFGINPVDWRRESMSFIHRIHKYKDYGYVPIFSGLNLDLAKELGEKTSYYLKDCQLLKLTQDNYIAKEMRRLTYEMVTMQFESSELECLVRLRKDSKALDKEEVFFRNLVREYRCLNLEDVPDQPFSSRFHDSDYDDASASSVETHHSEILSFTICKRYSLLSLYCKGDPINIVTDPQQISIRKVLLSKVADGKNLEFYLGTAEVTEIDKEIETCIIRKGRVPALKARKDKIIETRIKELEDRIEPHMAKLREGVKFATCKPGLQYTSSFKPILRQNPKEYWGSRCISIQPSRLYRMKITIMCIRKYHDTILRKFDKYIMQMIFWHLSNAYFHHMAESLPQHIPSADVLRLGL